MRKKILRFLGRWGLRVVIVACLFAMGWAAYAHFHPKPLLQDRWAALVQESDARARPGQGGKRGDVSPFGNGAEGIRPPGAGGGVVFSMDDLMAMRDPIAQALALVEALKTADTATCAGWWKTLEKHPHEIVRSTALAAVMERWTAIDPEAALAAMGDDISKKGDVFRLWAHRDAAAALAASGGKFNYQIHQGLLESDPDQGDSRWEELSPGSSFPIGAREPALKKLVKTDPEGALRQVPADDNDQTNEIRKNLFRSWMDRDADAAFKYAQESADPQVRARLLRTFAERFPDRMEPLLAGLKEGDEKNSLILAMARGKADKDLAAGARWLKSSVPPEKFPGILTDFARRQNGLNPSKLDTILSVCPDGAARDKMLTDLTGGTTYMVVMDWLKAQPPGSLSPAQQQMAFALLPGAQAAALVGGGVTFTPDEGFRMALKQSGKWSATKPAELAANLSALPESLQSVGIGGFLNMPAYLVDEGGKQSIADKLSPERLSGIFAALSPDAQGRTALNFAWKQQSDPAAAARFLAASTAPPDDPAAAAVYEKVAQNWINQDPAAASGWITGLPPGGARDAAALVLIQSQAASDPAAAAAWARTLQDPLTVSQAQQLLNSTPSNP